MATATDDNAEIRNLDARLFWKSTCRYTRHGVNSNIYYTKEEGERKGFHKGNT